MKNPRVQVGDDELPAFPKRRNPARSDSFTMQMGVRVMERRIVSPYGCFPEMRLVHVKLFEDFCSSGLFPPSADGKRFEGRAQATEVVEIVEIGRRADRVGFGGLQVTTN